MLKLRLLLGLIFTATVSFSVVMLLKIVPGIDPHGVMAAIIFVLSSFLAPFFAITALTLFVLSFFKIQVTENGYLAYDPQHICWKYVQWFSTEEERGKPTDFCRMFFKTAVAVLTGIVVLLVIVLVGLMLFIIFRVMYYGLPASFNWLDLLAPISGILGLIVVVCLPFLCGAMANNFDKRGKRTLKYVFMSLAVITVYGGYVALPIFGIMHKEELDFLSAFLEYLSIVGILATIGISFFGILLLHIFWESLPDDNILKRYYLAWKEETCLILVPQTAAVNQ